VAILVALTALSAGCVSSGKYRTLEQDRDTLSTRNKALEGDLEAANRKNSALAQEKSAMAAEITDVEKRLAELQATQKTLGSHCSVG
jgi:outer membrane murein-binding lipoprotein Lpp